MKLLLLCDSRSVWVKNFLENFLLDRSYEIWLPIFYETSEELLDFYIQKGVNLIRLPDSYINDSTSKRKNKFVTLLNKIKILKFLEKSSFYDIINVQFVSIWNLFFAVCIKKSNTKVIASYWGSDLFRVSSKKLRLTKLLFGKVDVLSFDSCDLQITFEKIYGSNYQSKSKYAPLGLPVLNYIDKLISENDQSYYKEKLGINEEKLVISVGYNGVPEQQHLKVLEALDRVPAKYRKKIILILQLTYGGNEEYRNRVIEKAKRLDYEVRAYTSFLTDVEVAKIRIVTDIYINSQLTDAFSGSVCEYLYSGTALLNAKWLHYKEMDIHKISFIEFSTFDEIPNLIVEFIEGYHIIDKTLNHDVIFKTHSWNSCKKNWQEIYEDTHKK